MPGFRIEKHPILTVPHRKQISVTWQGKPLFAYQDETIAAALFANGWRIFGHHHKDGSPQGIYCANGQCAQCLVLADGKPVKACIVLVTDGMIIEPVDDLPVLPAGVDIPSMKPVETLRVPVLIIGGGPAGLSAAIELGKLGIQVLLIDDKHRLGGKLVLQTHRFFGSVQAVYAGTRGIDIATRLETTLRQYPSVEIWLRSTALAVFSDRKIGVLKEGGHYVLIEPEILLSSAGAREKFLAFRGNTLPGVFGAGAFQTLVNRDMVRPAERLFIVGGGNVGLIAGYHALQAGIQVVGLVEALPECGGYKVHRDKLIRMGVPVYTSHTILSANGTQAVESVTITRVNERFEPVHGTERSFACDCILIAVGLDPVNEFEIKARGYGLTVYAAGDAEEIAEASAAMFSGKVNGLEIARKLGISVQDVPEEWYRTCEILKSKPGPVAKEILTDVGQGVVPMIHCTQEIPCNPCAAICAFGLISIDDQDIRQLPTYLGHPESCKGCERCVAICPGLAITLVDYRKEPLYPTVSIPYEFDKGSLQENDTVTVLDTEGQPLGDLVVVKVRSIPKNDRTAIVRVQAPVEIARRIAGIRVQAPAITLPLERFAIRLEDDAIICRCERVTAGEFRSLIHQGYHDLNEIKTVSRAGMGACGAKTCEALMLRLLREEGVPAEQVVRLTKRPLFIEVPVGIFAGEAEAQEGKDG